LEPRQLGGNCGQLARLVSGPWLETSPGLQRANSGAFSVDLGDELESAIAPIRECLWIRCANSSGAEPTGIGHRPVDVVAPHPRRRARLPVKVCGSSVQTARAGALTVLSSVTIRGGGSACPAIDSALRGAARVGSSPLTTARFS